MITICNHYVMERRDFLRLGSGLLALAAVSCSSSPPSGGGGRSGDAAWVASNRLRIPPQLAPDANGRLALRLQTGTTEFVAGRPTPTWGVNGAHLGPTLRLTRGEQARMRVTNALPETTTVHWHGLHPPAVADGGPHQPIAPGATWTPEWEVSNAPSTGWYHPHPHGATATHVFRGVAGLVYVDDDASRGLAVQRDYGVDDIPVILQDRTIDADGQMEWDTRPNFGQMGEDMLVNGTLHAFVDVDAQRVRLRLLNASNARMYNVGFADERTFHLIATDAGLLPEPVSLTRVALGPAERAEIVVELRPSEPVVLTTAHGPERIDEGTFSLLELRPAAQLRSSPPLPARLGGNGPLVAASGATTRTFRLQGHDAINGQEMDMKRIDEVVPAGAVEIWEVENNVYSHNFHIHGLEFTILDRDGSPPHAWETGRKDTVHVPEKSRVRLAVATPRLADAQHPYMYHCHILRHEDAGMMGQFVVVTPGAEAHTSRVLSGADHAGHL